MSSDPVAILAKRAGIPDRRIHRQADKPAEQQVVIQLLHQLPFRADRVERLQQQRPQQLFGRDARAANTRIKLVELWRKNVQQAA